MIIRNTRTMLFHLQRQKVYIILWIKNSMWQMLHFTVLVNNLFQIELNVYREQTGFGKIIPWVLFIGWACRHCHHWVYNDNLFHRFNFSTFFFGSGSVFAEQFWILGTWFRVHFTTIHGIKYWNESICKAARAKYHIRYTQFSEFYFVFGCLFFNTP